MMQAFTITISVPSGNPDQLRVITKTNRLSMALAFSRDDLAQVAQDRKELAYTGVYLLVNSSTNSLPEIYIGEGESVIDRLKSHNKDKRKEFWEWAVVFVARDDSLHKAHSKHLEAVLVQKAIDNNLCDLKNTVTPQTSHLMESTLFDAEDVLQDIYHILPLLGINAFQSVAATESQPQQILMAQARGITAYGFVAHGKFVVQKGSVMAATSTSSIPDGMVRLRKLLQDKQVVTQQGNAWVFGQDYAFSSPSTAASVVLGRSTNGRTDWKTQAGVSLKQLQAMAFSQESDTQG